MRRSDCDRVTERDELVGRLSLGSRLPQYLEGDSNGRSVTGHDSKMAMNVLDNSDVDGSSGTRPVDFALGHVAQWSRSKQWKDSLCWFL